jgi:hypothetical protein
VSPRLLRGLTDGEEVLPARGFAAKCHASMPLYDAFSPMGSVYAQGARLILGCCGYLVLSILSACEASVSDEHHGGLGGLAGNGPASDGKAGGRFGATDHGGAGNSRSEQLLQSQTRWAALKLQAGPDYEYTSAWWSLAGSAWETAIEVRADQVAQRIYRTGLRGGLLQDQWLETADEIGSHAFAAPPLTVEQVYAACLDLLRAHDAKKNVFEIAYDASGALKNCTFRPADCADDCDFGYRVSSLRFLK